jgi:hypothetical protein
VRRILRASIASVRVLTLTLAPMSLHRFGVAHQVSLRLLRTMMTYANSLRQGNRLQRILYLRAQTHPLMTVQQESSQV